ncbi:maltoporin [Klebsiella michiganensis]|uniref:Maltoporin n=1 Tax=Klebsiella michiganensis TaxID=1134687 RepID=A0A7H4LU43_9ENTR|nr:maltoporin [Klebsiella michiganensis]
MFAHRSDEVNLKKAYVGVTNVLESNPMPNRSRP